MVPDKPNSVVVNMESGNGKEMTNQNYAWNLGELGQTGSETHTASDTMATEDSCQSEATMVVKRGESISKYANFYSFRKSAYNILRVRKLTTQIRPFGRKILPALLPNLPKAIMNSSRNELDSPNQISNVSMICGEASFKQRQRDAPKTFSGAEAVESLKKYMEVRVSEVSLEAGQPKLRFIPLYMKFLYKLGLSPIPATTLKGNKNYVRAKQLVVFWVIATIASLRASIDLKESWLQFRVERDLLRFVTFGYFVVNLLTRVKLINCLTKMKDTRLDALQIRQVDTFNFRKCLDGPLGKGASIVGLLVSFSLMLTLATTIFGNLSRESWSFGNMQLVQSYQLSHALFIWRPRDWNNSTETYLEENYGTNLTFETISLATFGNILTICGTLHAQAVVDLFLVLALEVHQIQVNLTTDIGMTKLSVPSEDTEFSINWTLYRKARNTCEQLNEVFGALLKVAHMKNMVEISYLLVRILTDQNLTVKFLVDICNATKVAFAYRLIKKCAEKNDKLEDFVTLYSKNRTEIDVEGKQTNVTLLLRGMKKHPIGLGRGEFFVDEAFVLKMASAIGAVFTLLMDQLDKKDC